MSINRTYRIVTSGVHFKIQRKGYGYTYKPVRTWLFWFKMKHVKENIKDWEDVQEYNRCRWVGFGYTKCVRDVRLYPSFYSAGMGFVRLVESESEPLPESLTVLTTATVVSK